jgi:cytochrome P450
MKDKTVFGHDADVFEPQRWLHAEPARLKAMLSVQGLVFASGSRWECLGKRLAYLELGKAVFEVTSSLQPPHLSRCWLTKMVSSFVILTLACLIRCSPSRGRASEPLFIKA